MGVTSPTRRPINASEMPIPRYVLSTRRAENIPGNWRDKMTKQVVGEERDGDLGKDWRRPYIRVGELVFGALT